MHFFYKDSKLKKNFFEGTGGGDVRGARVIFQIRIQLFKIIFSWDMGLRGEEMGLE